MTQILSILALDSVKCFRRRKTGKMVFENESCSFVGANDKSMGGLAIACKATIKRKV